MYITYLYIRSILVFWCISFVCNNRGTALMHGINQILHLLTGIDPKIFVKLPKVDSYCLVLFPRLLFSRHTINSQLEWDRVTSGHSLTLTWLTTNQYVWDRYPVERPNKWHVLGGIWEHHITYQAFNNLNYFGKKGGESVIVKI